jgi:hypothetical protein
MDPVEPMSVRTGLRVGIECLTWFGRSLRPRPGSAPAQSATMTAEDPSTGVIHASPTKDLVLEMLTRDVQLVPAIVDLVDNSVDGAIGLRPTRKGDEARFAGLYVRISLDEKRFQITDNCGGIPLKLATDYAFRFGRRKGGTASAGSTHPLGAFGVGMKRALFKMGRMITISTTALHERYKIIINLEKWMTKDDDWDFQYQDLERNPKGFADGERGTTIEVSNLFEEIREDFKVEAFVNGLRKELAGAHHLNAEQGLEIKVNGESAPAPLIEVINAPELDLVPGSQKLYWPHPDGTITGFIKVGIARSGADAVDAGWTVYCNGRMVLHGNKDRLTGWSDTLPRWHPQYGPFRGVVILESKNPRQLPWNTTKDGVDENHWAFRRAKLHMTELAQPIKTFLDARKKALDAGSDDVIDTFKNKPRTAILDTPATSEFRAPKVKIPDTTTAERINFLVERDRFNAVAKVVSRKLGKASVPNSKVGLFTFEYFEKRVE